MSIELLAPDGGEALRLAFRAQPTVTAITATRIGLTLTGPDPAIRYALTGTLDHGGGATSPTYQVECWGRGGGVPDDGTSDLLARTVKSVIPSLVGVYGNARVVGASYGSAYRSDDPTSGRPRTILPVTITLQPLPQGA